MPAAVSLGYRLMIQMASVCLVAVSCGPDGTAEGAAGRLSGETSLTDRVDDRGRDDDDRRDDDGRDRGDDRRDDDGRDRGDDRRDRDDDRDIDCRTVARQVQRRCLAAGESEATCTRRARAAAEACRDRIHDEDDDDGYEDEDDDDRCTAFGRRVYRRCLDTDATERACRRRAAAVVDACLDEDDESRRGGGDKEDRRDRDDRVRDDRSGSGDRG